MADSSGRGDPAIHPDDISAGDTVLAWHQGNLFEAKVIEGGPANFRVHYKGFSVKWNEDVPRSRLLVNNELNRQLQAETKRQSKVKESSRARPKASEATADGQLPEALQQRLADDWERISLRRYLVHVPVPSTQRSVSDILGEFQVQHPAMAGLIDDIFRLFNVSIGGQLLYRVERKQFEEAWRLCEASKVSIDPQEQMRSLATAMPLSERRANIARAQPAPVVPADLYGVEHLLRLLVKMPRLLWDAKEDEDARSAAASAITMLGNFIEGAQFTSDTHGDSAKTMWSAYKSNTQ